VKNPRGLLLLLSATLGCLCIFLAILYPLQRPPWRTFVGEWFFALFILIGHLNLSLAQPRLLSTPFIATLGVVSLGASLCVGLLGFSNPLLWTLIYCILAWLAYTKGLNSESADVKHYVMSLVLALMLATLIGIMQRYDIVQIPDSLRAFVYIESDPTRTATSIGQPNRFGVMAVIAAFLSLWLISQTDRKWSKIGLVLVIGILMQGAVISQSRIAVLGLITTTLVIISTRYVFTKTKSYKSLLLYLTPLMFYIVLAVIHSFALGMESRTLPFSQEASYTDPQRVRIWMLGLDAIFQSPWSGHGPGSVPSLALDYSPMYGAFQYLIVTHLHNTPLDFLVEYGIPAGILITILLYSWWIKSILDSLKTDKILITCATIPLMMHSMVEYPLYYGYFLWLLFWLLGFTASDRVRNSGKVIQIHRAPRLAFISLALVACFLTLQTYLQVERMYTWARNDRPDEVRVAAASPSALQTILFGGLVKQIAWLVTEVGPDSRLTPEQIADLESAARAHPQYLLVWRSAVANAASGRPDKAAWWAERLCHMFEPESCKAAKELWESVDRPDWPKLDWERWLKPTSPRPGQGMS